MGPLINSQATSPGDESTPLLNESPIPTAPCHQHDSVSRRLYMSHFLSTWNSRVFEFGAVLYLAAIFPGTLLPMSVYAMARGVAAIVLAPMIGQYIDTGNRLQVVRVSIVLQRLPVAASCIVFYVLASDTSRDGAVKMGMLVLITFLACVEKLCSVMNTVAVERDWVVVVASDDQGILKSMNAQMRRIDLFCKIFGPLFIALVSGFSTKAAIVINFAMNTLSVVMEYFAIARVYIDVPELQKPKQAASTEHLALPLSSDGASNRSQPNSPAKRIKDMASALVKKPLADMLFYFRHQAFLPSFAGALLYLTVLSFAGQMITYLLSAGYTTTQIGIARTLSVVFEVLATWAAPWLMARIGPVRAGLWLSSWQVATLVVGIAVFWVYDESPLIAATGLVGGTILSRLGLRGFDLCASLFVQEHVEAESRGAFSSVEAAWQNAFEIASFASTIIFYRPEQFKWPSLISLTAVSCASAAYAFFVYLKRGHLLHLELLGQCFCVGSEKGLEWDGVREHMTREMDV